jgi:hypothetical protein
MARGLGASLLAALAGYHGWLLQARLVGDAGFDTLALFRWGAAIALVCALAWLRWQGIPLLRGRKALVVWMLVLFLHHHEIGRAYAQMSGAGAELAVPALVIGSALVAARALRRRVTGRWLPAPPVPTLRWMLAVLPDAPRVPVCFSPPLFSRPPPALA